MAPDHEPAGEAARSLLDGLDPAQLEAVTTEASPLCILAGAGSGKTRVLTRRIAHRVAGGSALPGHVLALTFTRKAAGELGRRLAALGVRHRVAAGTFHATAWAQLRRHWSDSGRWAPSLLDHKGRLLAAIAPTGSGPPATADLAAEIEWAKARLVRPGDYEEAVNRAGRRPPLAAELVASVYRRYEDEKRRRRLVDFDDLVLLCADALETDAGFAAAQRWRFRHLFVDEFQDVNPAQFRLLEAWRGERPDVCVVGDPDQAIYAWNGADPSFLTTFHRRLPGASVVHLDRNHRSSPQVVAVANAVLHGRRAAGARELRPTAGDGPLPRVVAYPTDGEEAAGVVAALRAQHRNGRLWSELAVLARTRAQLVAIEEALRTAGVPCRVKGTGAFLAQPEVAQVVGRLRRLPPGSSLADALARLEAELVPLAHDVAPSGHGSGAAEVAASLRELARIMDEQLALDPVASVGWFVGWLATTLGGDDPDAEHDAVVLATFHAAKGLEWPVVFLIGLEHGLVPISRADTPEARAEERRLLYVAVTRTRRELHCSWAERRRFGTCTVARSPSPWLATVDDAITALTAAGAERSGDWLQHLHEARARARSEGHRPAGAGRTRGPGVEVGEGADPTVLAALRSWRAEAAQAAGVPAFVVLHDSTLATVAEARPGDRAALLALPGMGPLKAERYGDALLAVVATGSVGSWWGPGGSAVDGGPIRRDN